MRHLLIALMALPSLALEATEQTDAPATGAANPAELTAPAKPARGKPIEELSDEFLGDVADGSKPAADGTREEESGDTMDQTLRTHTRSLP